MIRVDDIPSMKSPVYVGNQGEKNILTLDFDYTSWHALYGNGDFSATYQNPKGRINLLPPSDFSTEIAGENEDLTYILHFTVTKNITAISGTGTLCLYYMGIGESFSKTSVLVPVVVEKGHDTISTPPVMFQDWVDQAHATLDEITPKWSSANISVTSLAEGSEPTASVLQGQNGTTINLGIPKGDQGAQGPKGDIQFVAFYIDFSTGQLMMIIPEGYTGPIFRLNEETGELEVTV